MKLFFRDFGSRQVNRFTVYLKVMFRSFMYPFAWSIHLFLAVTEKRKEFEAPVFIVGAPRTGSTILYQSLTNFYRVAYIDNLACRWNRFLRFGMWLSKFFYGRTPHDSFKANYGSTEDAGLHGPSECGGFWYRWLPVDRHFIDYHDITKEMVSEIRDEVIGSSKVFGMPLLFKNLNAGQRLRLIKQAFPGARIIFIRRDPRFVVRSIMKARSKNGVKKGDWWSIMPPNFKELLKLPELDMSVAQVFYLEAQIEIDLKLFPQENVREVHYQDLSDSCIKGLGDWIGLEERDGGSLPKFHQDSIGSFVADELEEIESEIKKYSFKDDLFIS